MIGPAFTLLRRELAGYFFVPLGWLVLALFLLVQGYVFYLVTELLSAPLAPHGSPLQLLFGGTYSYWLVLIFVSAAVSTRLLAEEQRAGTIDVLLSAPITEAQVVVGKYAAAVLFFAALWLPTGLYVLVLARLAGGQPLDAGPVLAGYFGTLLVGSAFLAVGTLASALVSHQLLAALLTFGALLLLLLLGPLELFLRDPTLRAIVAHLDLFAQLDEYARGIVDARRVVLDLSIVVFCLVCATKRLEQRRR